MFSHDFCEFPSISVPRQSHSHCHHCLANSPNHLVLLTTVSLPAELQRWFTLAGYPLISASCCWGFSSFSSLPPHVSSTSPVNSTAHLLPPTSAHLSYLYLFCLLLILFSFRFLRIQKKNICSLLDMEAFLRLSVYSGGPVFPGTLHQKSLWLDWFS